MKTKRLRSWIFSGLLLLTAAVLIIGLADVFVMGPYYKGITDNTRRSEQLEKQLKAESGEFLNRHVVKEAISVSLYTIEGQKMLVFYDDALNVKAKKRAENFDEAVIRQKAKEMYNIEKEEISLGYYKKPVVVLKGQYYEILLDFDTLDQVLFLTKG